MKNSVFLLIGLAMLALSAWAISADDPFGAAPKGVSPNCGPEHRYKYDLKIRSLDDFLDFVKKHSAQLKDSYGNHWISPDDFLEVKPTPGGMQRTQGTVDWEKVRKQVKTETLKGRTVYSLHFEPLLCIAQGFTLKVTSDGHVSLYGCCGK